MKVLVVEPHKKPYEKDVEHTLESLQGIVGGLIEPIYFDDSAIIVNEEGKIKEEDFTDIPEQAIPKYSRMFSRNEFLIRTESGIGVFTL